VPAGYPSTSRIGDHQIRADERTDKISSRGGKSDRGSCRRRKKATWGQQRCRHRHIVEAHGRTTRGPQSRLGGPPTHAAAQAQPRESAALDSAPFNQRLGRTVSNTGKTLSDPPHPAATITGCAGKPAAQAPIVAAAKIMARNRPVRWMIATLGTGLSTALDPLAELFANNWPRTDDDVHSCGNRARTFDGDGLQTAGAVAVNETFSNRTIFFFGFRSTAGQSIRHAQIYPAKRRK